MLIQDISRYQQKVNFSLLKGKKQDYIIEKVGGSLNVDSKFVSHYTNGTASGMSVAGYYWDDPNIDGEAQAKHFLATVKDKNIAFLEVDFEHWWADWDRWEQWMQGDIPMSEVPIVPSDKLLANLVAFYNYLKANTDLNVVIYTATWFLDTYCPEAYAFLSNVYTHFANYSYFDDTPVFASWDTLEAIAPVGRPIPKLPASYPLDKVILFQYSGDKYTADGVWGNPEGTQYSELDLSLWVSKTISIETFCKIPGGTTMPPITVPTFVQSTKFVKTLNIPYVPQLGPGAGAYNNDCGAACGSMLVQGYTDQKPTVDQFYQATGVGADVYLAAYQIIGALAHYGVSTNWKISNLPTLLVDLNSGRPVVCLISYGSLVDAKITQNVTFRGFHFVVAVGYDAENIYIDDPLWNTQGGKEVAVPQGIFNRAWQQAGANPSLNPAFGCLVPSAVIGVPVTVTSVNYKVIADKLNVRSAPNSNLPNVVSALYYGNVVQIESIDKEGWGKITGKTQYVYMYWLVKI